MSVDEGLYFMTGMLLIVLVAKYFFGED